MIDEQKASYEILKEWIIQFSIFKTPFIFTIFLFALGMIHQKLSQV